MALTLKNMDREGARVEAGRLTKLLAGVHASNDWDLDCGGGWQWAEVRPVIWKGLEGESAGLDEWSWWR